MFASLYEEIERWAMIVCVTYENIYKYGMAFRSQFYLRHQCFIERQNYNVSKYNGMEFDQYDNPAAIYLVYLSPQGEAWGCSRLTPVTQGSMVKHLWPELVDHPEDVFVHGVWEGTRFCIDKTLPVDVRKNICRELVVAYFEAGLEFGIQKIIGVMQPLIFRKVFGSAGCKYNLLGQKMKITSGETIAAAVMNVTPSALEDIRETTGIFEQVIVNGSNQAKNERHAA